MASRSMPLYQKLKYAGVDLDALKTKPQLWVSHSGSAETFHSREECYSGSRRSRREGRKVVTRTASDVPVSRGCSGCFDGVVIDDHWAEYTNIARAISDDDAAFLRTALAKKSKKNTPAEAARVADRLRVIAGKIESVRAHLGDEVSDVADKLERRLRARADEVRAAFADPSVRDAVLREAAALAATYSIPTKSLDLAHRSQYEYRLEIEKAASSWAIAIGASDDVARATKTAARHLVGVSSYGSSQQLRFLTPRAPRADETLESFLYSVWAEQVGQKAERLTNRWAQKYAELRSSESTSLAVLAQPESYAGTFAAQNERLVSSLIELFCVHRSGARVALLMPTALLPLLSTAGANSRPYFTVTHTPADDVDEVVANTAASLFGPENDGFSALDAALAAARALA